jgi:Na+/H+ antiporter NhaD/arsenite permease-like protein
VYSSIAAIPMTSVIFSLTYLALAIGKVPRLEVDRAGIAVIGMAAMLAAGLVDLREAASAVDFETIALLFGMMVLVACLRIAGFFRIATDLVVARRPGPYQLLALTMGLSGVLSAFLVNDVVCVALTPLMLEVCRRSGRPAVPYLIGLATASNVGSVATITGNPQNMIIGSLSGISYLRFADRMLPLAVIGLFVNFLIVAWVYRRSLAADGGVSDFDETPPTDEVDRGLLTKGLIVTLGVLVAFFIGKPVGVVAVVAAALMLAGRVPPEKIYRLVDWPLLAMFVGLFVVVHVFNARVVDGWSPQRWRMLADWPVSTISGLSLVLSNVVSNVPAVLLFQPVIDVVPDAERAWLALAMSSTFAGNLTLLGSVANLIVVENARRAGTEIGFREYLKVGIPVTLLTCLVGVAWIAWIGN